MGTIMNTLTDKGKQMKIQVNPMLDVLIALLPATVVGIFNYKGQALWIILLSILASIITEAIWQKLCKKKVTTRDLSAVVSGLILALILPVHVPLWIPVAGSIFATLFVKQFFGGVGHNFMNPALAAKVFLMTSWASVMMKPVVDSASSASQAVETVTSASQTAASTTASSFSTLWQSFLFQNGGNIGELSTAALLAGGLYLIIRKVISYKIPLSFILAYSVMYWIIGGQAGIFTGDPINPIISGVLAIAVFFMANDPSSTPTSTIAQILFGAGCGILGTIFRVYGYNSEGAYYSILVMNLFVPLFEKLSTLLVNNLKSR